MQVSYMSKLCQNNKSLLPVSLMTHKRSSLYHTLDVAPVELPFGQFAGQWSTIGGYYRHACQSPFPFDRNHFVGKFFGHSGAVANKNHTNAHAAYASCTCTDEKLETIDTDSSNPNYGARLGYVGCPHQS